MSSKIAAANVTPVRQRTQFTCMAASMAMALRACGIDCTEDEVNKVMGCAPAKGARWEEILACAQHYGCRAILTVPATLTQVKGWTDEGHPVIIAWNPEGRPWSHASVLFDVVDNDEGRHVKVADPNIPNPDQTVRMMGEDEFYGKWYEKWPQYLVRRPACVIMREIDESGRQVMASRHKAPKKRNPIVRDMIERSWGSGKHKNKGQRGTGQKGKGKGQRHPKHKRDLRRMASLVAAEWVRASYTGRLDQPLRSKVNRALLSRGLDGNGRWERPERAFSAAVETLQEHGIEMDTVVSSHLFRARPSGHINVDLAFTNQTDPFSPLPIQNSVLVLQFTELRPDVFEAIAYLS